MGSVLLNRIAQGADNMILPQHIIEGGGSVFSGKDLITVSVL
jgi:hypothetical protein